MSFCRSFARAVAGLRARVGAALHQLADVVADEPDVITNKPFPAYAYVLATLAGLMPLPVAPIPSGDPAIDGENLITYQAALAEHAHRDALMRSFGALVDSVRA